MNPVYTIGDIHGQYDKLVSLLKSVPLVDEDLHWTGGDAQLWFVGDFFDRGPDGIGTVELIMRLQNQAAQAGGTVGAVIGNHDMNIMAAYRFGTSRALITNPPQSPEEFAFDDIDSFTALWLSNGGAPSDLRRMTAKHMAWLTHLPGMVRIGDKLLLHADSVMYQRYGDTPDDVNAHFHRVLTGSDANEWDLLIDDFNQHRAFITTGGTHRAVRFLKIFGCSQMIHGHTPIPTLTRHTATEPLVYANGRCVNIDGGMYQGGPGFVYRIA